MQPSREESRLRRRLACFNCRTVKARCTPLTQTLGSPCTRCTEHSVLCTYPSRRNRGQTVPSDSRHRSASPSVGANNHQMAPTTASSSFTPPGTVETRRVFSDYTSTIPVYPPSSAPINATDVASSTRKSPLASSIVASQSPQISLDISKHLDPLNSTENSLFDDSYLQPLHGRPLMAAADPVASNSDPVALQLLSAIEAGNLLISFMEHLNPMVALLDPEMHTFQILRRSPILFTAILAASAKFFRKELYEPLSSHCLVLLLRSIFAGECSIEIIKALTISVFWKTPKDRSAWVKIGIALRLSHQLQLHVPRTEPLPFDHDEARSIRDRERTWYCLSCTDRIYSDIFGLPPISEDQFKDIEEWMNEISGPSRSIDLHLVCSMELAAAHLMLIKIKKATDDVSREWKFTVLSQLARQYSSHIKKWFQIETALSKVERNFLFWYHLCTLIDIQYRLMECSLFSEVPTKEQEVLDLIERFVDQTKLMAQTESLLYLQDTSAAQMSTLGSLIQKLFARVDLRRKRVILHHVTTICGCCQSNSNGDDSIPVAFVTRFYARLERRLAQALPPADERETADWRRNSTEYSSTDANSHALSSSATFQFGQTTGLGDASLADDEYWSSLFVAPWPEIDLAPVAGSTAANIAGQFLS